MLEDHETTIDQQTGEPFVDPRGETPDVGPEDVDAPDAGPEDVGTDTETADGDPVDAAAPPPEHEIDPAEEPVVAGEEPVGDLALPDAGEDSGGSAPIEAPDAGTSEPPAMDAEGDSDVASQAEVEPPVIADPADEPSDPATEAPPAKKSKKSTRKKSSKKAPAAAEPETATATESAGEELPETAGDDAAVTTQPRAKRPSRKKSTKPKTVATETAAVTAGPSAPEQPLFQPPDLSSAEPATLADDTDTDTDTAAEGVSDAETDAGADDATTENGDSPTRRRRRRGGRRRRKSADTEGDNAVAAPEGEPAEAAAPEESSEPSSRRRRRRRRSGDDARAASEGETADDPENTVTKMRKGRSADDEITAVNGSTRLEAKKQRRREGREAGRRRAPIVSEAEFLARRESVDRVMVIRQRDDVTQIAVLEDKVLVEHYVARESQASLIGNIYLGRVQNVLPSMEAAFIDIGKGRNAVLYAGEVNWSGLGHPDGQPRQIESVLSSGQAVMVQVTKDPIAHKGARLTSQISLAGRFLVYVPDGTTSGISRKLPDTERHRLKSLLKEIVPDSAGVIVRTAAEGASEEELTRDVERLKARWAEIKTKTRGGAPQLLYGEPDLTVKVVRDLFTEDFSALVVQGDEAWETVHGYVTHVAPDLEARLQRYQPDDSGRDAFAAYRIDEQIAKGLDRKVWLPSGGSLVIDRTEAMTVVDVNTGKFTGSGGNLEETVTKNNLEAAEEIVRQLRLRDIGGIIVVDFIDMVLESNRDLVLRRMVECLGRDRTRHQVAEVTSLGLVQMTRKRIGTGLLEAFSEPCEHCSGRGVVLLDAPVEPKRGEDSRRPRRRGSRGRAGDPAPAARPVPSPADLAATSRPPAVVTEDGLEDLSADAVADVDAPVVIDPDSTEPDSTGLDPTEPDPAEPDPTQSGTGDAGTPQADPVSEVGLDIPVLPSVDDQGPAALLPAAAPTELPGPPAATVTTRSRRRSASRPAGPPAPVEEAVPTDEPASIDQAAPIAEPAVGEPALPDVPRDEPPVVEHVPVKKRGSRKR